MSSDDIRDRWQDLESERPRTLIFSHRKLTTIQPFRCAHFEFEDVISEVDNVLLLTPQIDPSSWRYAFCKQLAYYAPIKLNPGVEWAALPNDFEVFLAICGGPTDLLHIRTIGDWRSRCRKAICLIDEVWAREVGNYRNYLRMLCDFDLVVLYYSQSVGPVNEIIGEQKCTFVPPAVDTLRFCPYPDPPKRVVDVYSMGRRSPVTHKAFLKMAANHGMFYVYDSTSADRVLDPVEHRILFANLSKRSRYFIVNPGLIDRPDIRGSQIEIGNRYFEAAASGSILLGERPQNGKVEQFFDWPDAIIDMPYNSRHAEKIISELDAEPERQAAIRQQNSKQALLRHDWAYRWETILSQINVPPLPNLERRKQQLRDLAVNIDEISCPKKQSHSGFTAK